MFEIVRMREEDRVNVMQMAEVFYHSPAVCHAVPASTLLRTFEAALSGEQGLDGYVLLEDEKVVGFAYITEFYACEVGGKSVMLEEIYLKEEARKKGYATQFFHWMFETYSYAKRFRLEASMENPGAIRLYERLGFTFLDYRQMVRDVL